MKQNIEGWKQYQELLEESRNPVECLKEINELFVEKIVTYHTNNGEITEIYVKPLNNNPDGSNIRCIYFAGNPHCEGGDTIDVLVAAYKEVNLQSNKTLYIPVKLNELGERVEAFIIYNRSKGRIEYSRTCPEGLYTLPQSPIKREVFNPLGDAM